MTPTPYKDSDPKDANTSEIIVAELQALQRRYNALSSAVRRMRGHQNEYFAWRASSDLKLAKKAEKIVDQLLQQDINENKAKQGNLFKRNT